MNIMIPRTRFGGRAVERANEEPAPSLSGEFRVLDAQGRDMGMGTVAGEGDGRYAVVRANAITAQAAAVSPLLTNYANGYPQDNVQEVVNWFAPQVPVPAIFQYRNPALANELGTVTNDQVGYTGEPQIVGIDPESLVPGQLIFRGLETSFTQQDRTLAAAMLGNSAELERQRRIRFLLGQVRRGRAARVYAAVAAAAGAASAVTIYKDDDPYKILRTYLQNAILEAGSPEYVRICMGYSNEAGFQDHPLLNGVTAGQRRTVTMADIALGLGIPAANLRTSWHQVVTTAQGRTAAKSVLIGGDQFWIFVCRPNPSEEDNSWMKTFTLAGQGNGQDPFSVYTYEPHPLFERMGLSYWELLKVTNSNTYAVQRLALTWSASNRG